MITALNDGASKAYETVIHVSGGAMRTDVEGPPLRRGCH
ncbi:hypothetical protein FH063_003925 [Azospirillum argentinense]|uniref:Uncharacterized protein n=1 Tax=Azospirillum argentinense TaxID=2970906 RepID=A0A5B0KWN8_9PROT|nr:hypothetical protein FH063_003925 [Azospirillum argentinense]